MYDVDVRSFMCRYRENRIECECGSCFALLARNAITSLTLFSRAGLSYPAPRAVSMEFFAMPVQPDPSNHFLSTFKTVGLRMLRYLEPSQASRRLKQNGGDSSRDSRLCDIGLRSIDSMFSR